MRKVVYSPSYGGCWPSCQCLYVMQALGYPLTPVSKEFCSEELASFRIAFADGTWGSPELALLRKGEEVFGATLTDADRSHPAFVAAVELLGPLATSSPESRIVEVKDGTPYRIRDYDGAESVELLSVESYTQGHLFQPPVVPPLLQQELANLRGSTR